MLVYISIKVSLSATFDCLSVTLILCNIRDDAIIPKGFARSAGIKTAVGIEQRTFIVQMASFHIRKELLECSFDVKGIVMMASNNACCGNDVAILVS